MKIGNLFFSILVLVVAIVLLANIGWGLSYLWDIEFQLNPEFQYPEVFYFISRVLIGLVLLGYIVGMGKLWDLFYYCMTLPPAKKRGIK